MVGGIDYIIQQNKFLINLNASRQNAESSEIKVVATSPPLGGFFSQSFCFLPLKINVLKGQKLQQLTDRGVQFYISKDTY